jgi:hypothetical protein
MNGFHVPNPITASAGGTIPAPFAVFKLLEALAPSLIGDGFSAVPGGLRLDTVAVDIIIDPEAALGDQNSNNYVLKHGCDLFIVTDTTTGLIMSATVRAEDGLRHIADMRPWFQVSTPSLVLVSPTAATHGHGGAAVVIAANAAVRVTGLLCGSAGQLDRGFNDAHILTDLWRDVLTMGRAAA